jgi:hypothetical protein
MGHNINLVDMVGAPEGVNCPNCGSTVRMWFDDIDVDSTYTNPEPGVYAASAECENCEKRVAVRIKCSAFVESVSIEDK